VIGEQRIDLEYRRAVVILLPDKILIKNRAKQFLCQVTGHNAAFFWHDSCRATSANLLPDEVGTDFGIKKPCQP
jgi:hypothetical protein